MLKNKFFVAKLALILFFCACTYNQLLQSGNEVSFVFSDKDYGEYELFPFSPSWLSDYPLVLEHVESEQLLHVKGKDEAGVGLTWHTEKFETDMDMRFNPEAIIKGGVRGGFQMKLGYFLVPEEKIRAVKASGLSLSLLAQIEVFKDGHKYYRFYIHPLAYDHFRALHADPMVTFVRPADSDLIATASSSFRSLVVRSVTLDKNGNWIPKDNSLPYVLKMGVPGSILGSDRWLTPNEIERSIYVQMALDELPSHVFSKPKNRSDNFYVFAENMGLMLQNIQNYPPRSNDKEAVSKESGLILREFPVEMLEGKSRFLSFAALMSPERVKPETRGVGGFWENAKELPLIYEIVEAAIRAGYVTSTYEFVQKYLIESFLSAFESIVFEEGFRPEPHSQNFLLVLNTDYTPKGFAYRDFGGIWVDIATRGLQDKNISIFQKTGSKIHHTFKTKGAIAKAYIYSYSWFYRYQIFVKILNSLARVDAEQIPPPPGAPYQIGKSEPLPERILYSYLYQHSSPVARSILEERSLTLQQYRELLALLDQGYMELLNKYFKLEEIAINYIDGLLPSAETDSAGEHLLYKHNGFLGKYRFIRPSTSVKQPLNVLPNDILNRAQEQCITSFESLPFPEVGASTFSIENRGLWFFNDKQEIVGFLPYCQGEDKHSIERACSFNQ